MKRLVVNLLAVATCLLFCVGCSTLKPAQEPRTAAAGPLVPKQASAPHNYPFKWFVRGWLLGQAPPPDVHENTNGSWGWYYLGMILECLGQGLNK